MKKRAALLFLALSGAMAAAPLTRDLGEGLVYHRVHQLPGDLPTAEAQRKQACVLDLRFVHGDGNAASVLDNWLRFHATAHTPVFVLANVETSRALLAPLTDRGPAASIVVLGIGAEGFAPDIALTVGADIDRRAYDALENGTSISALLNDSPEKTRNDEARLAHDRQADAAAAADPVDKAPSTPPSPPPLTDAVLQRAVQLHRALEALKRI